MTPDGQTPNIDRFPLNKVIHIMNMIFIIISTWNIEIKMKHVVENFLFKKCRNLTVFLPLTKLGLTHFSASAALHVSFLLSVSVAHSFLSFKQKLMLHVIFWFPFPATHGNITILEFNPKKFKKGIYPKIEI